MKRIVYNPGDLPLSVFINCLVFEKVFMVFSYRGARGGNLVFV